MGHHTSENDMITRDTRANVIYEKLSSFFTLVEGLLLTPKAKHLSDIHLNVML